jgi:hypothetical protein
MSNPNDPRRQHPPAKTNGAAITALILAIMTPPFGVALGFIAVTQIKRTKEGVREPASPDPRAIGTLQGRIRKPHLPSNGCTSVKYVV